MKGRMFKLILSALMSSATVLTSVPASAFAETASRANSESNHAHVHEHDDCEETDEHIHEDCYEEDVLGSCAEEHEHAEDAACCDSHEELLLGDGITVAVLDSGITSFETAKDISFVDDAEFSEHGNMMAETLINEVPEITLYDVRVLDSEGKGKYSDISEAIVWSVDNDADIIVMSFEGFEASTILEDAINYAAQNDVLMIAAAGNDGLEKAVYPAAYPTVISAGSLNEDGNISSFSNYGASVDVFVNASAGTSVAAQHVAADAVRYMQENPSATDEEAREALVGSKSKDFTPVSGSADSYVYEAVTHHYGSWYTYTKATCEKNRVERRKCSDKYCYAYQERTVSNTKLGHSWSAWKVGKNATCTATGSKYRNCTRSGCGATDTTTYGPNGHIRSWQTKTAATCTTNRLEQYKCHNCGNVSSQREVSNTKLGHSWGAWKVGKNATCTATGSKYRNCTRSGCGATDTTTYGPNGHYWSGWTTLTPATCLKPEVQQRKCYNCLIKETRNYGSPLTHSWGEWKVGKNATCTATGSKYRNCTRSGCGATDTTTYGPNGHKRSWQTKTPATCTANGLEQYKCHNCGNVSSERVINKLNHSIIITTNSAGQKYEKCSRSGCTYKVDPVKITKQPTSVSVTIGSTAKTSVTATGKGLTYQWYYKNAGASSYTKSSATSSTYSVTMTSAISGRQVYCEITDTYGNRIKSSTATLKSKVAITKQPTSVFVTMGSTAKTSVTATGNGLKYQWYYKNAGASSYTKSSATSSTYSVTMTSAISGRQVYCVITDKYGNKLQSSPATLKSKVAITKQPTSVFVTIGSTAKTSVTATGNGLKYQWYYRDPGKTSFAKSSATSSTYSVTMTGSISGRQVYCVVTDQYNNSVTSGKATLYSKVSISKQPASVSVAMGSTAKTSVTATGNGLKYQWYYKNAGASSYTKSSATSSTYSVTMTSAISGRQVYCEITDAYGNRIKSSTATLKSKVAITKQPTSVFVTMGSTAKTSVTATGNGLKYQWYYKNAGASSYTKSSATSSTYSVTMSSTVDGRQVYCEITDAYGNKIKSSTATLKSKVAITKQPSDTYVSIGSTAKATVIASGSGLKYQWYYTVPGGSVTALPSSTSSTYSVTMTAAISGRQVYCKITDKYGNFVKSSTAILRSKATITKQPTSVSVAMGSTAKTSVTATGNGLKYQWYYKESGGSGFSKSSRTSSTYSATMDKSSDGRQIYCEITDAYGKTVRTKTVTLTSKVAITKQPTNATAKYGSTVKTTVTATGNGLKYQWYVKSVGYSSFSKSSITSATYSTTMSSTVDGRQLYCEVTDKYGNTVKSNKITFKKTPELKIYDNGNTLFTLRANGDYAGQESDRFELNDTKHVYLSLYFTADEAWTLKSSSNYLHLGYTADPGDNPVRFTQSSTSSISGGAGTYYALIRANVNYAAARTCKITFTMGGTTKTYTIEQYAPFVDGINKNTHINNVKNASWYNHVPTNMKDYFYGNAVTGGIKTFKSASSDDGDTYGAVESFFEPTSCNIITKYIFFKVTYSNALNANKKIIKISVLYNKDMSINQSADTPLLSITGSPRLSQIDIDCTDLNLEQRTTIVNACLGGGRFILSKIPYVKYASGAIMFVAKLGTDSYLKKIDNTDKYSLASIEELSIYMLDNTLLKDKDDELYVEYYNDGASNKYTVNLNIKSSTESAVYNPTFTH